MPFSGSFVDLPGITGRISGSKDPRYGSGQVPVHPDKRPVQPESGQEPVQGICFPEQEKTVVNLDYKMRADNLNFAAQEPWRCFAEQTFAFSYDIIPV